MPWRKRTLALPASPRSVRRARRWVAEGLTEIGRPELVDSGRLGVSELVTNAILHAEPPITVKLRGTQEHPRIEVSDQSVLPPQPRTEGSTIDRDDPHTWTTGGRGLNLVASHSVAWGADIDQSGEGKVVWFEPAAEPRVAVTEGSVFDLDQALIDLDLPPAEPEDMLTVELIGFPVRLFIEFRLHFYELGRELRLLSVSNPGQYPLADEFTKVLLQVEHERRQVRGLDELARADALGLEEIDLHYVAPRSVTQTMTRLSALLEEVYATFPEDVLLAVQPAPDVEAVQSWYLGEFGRQGSGAEPTPWKNWSGSGRRQDVT